MAGPDGRSDADSDVAIIDYLASSTPAIVALKQAAFTRASAACWKLANHDLDLDQ
jgi:hypothetical protein